jgi:hypothetical protein
VRLNGLMGVVFGWVDWCIRVLEGYEALGTCWVELLLDMWIELRCWYCNFNCL